MDRVSGGSAARRLETAGFVLAAIAYLLPFFDYRWVQIPGLELFFLSFQGLARSPSVPLGLYFFSATQLPLLAVLAGLLYRHVSARAGAPVGFILALAGFAGLAIGFVWNPRPPFAFGYYAAEVGFLVAAVGAGWRLLWHDSSRPLPPRDEPAESASQWLVRRSRNGW